MVKPAITRGFDERYRILMRNNNQECVHLLEPIQAQPITIERHHHAFYEVLFVISGELSYEVEGRHYQLKGGDIILINPLQFHSGELNPSKPYERCVLWLHPTCVARLKAQHPKINLLRAFDTLKACGTDLIKVSSEDFTELQLILARLFSISEQESPEALVMRDCLTTMTLLLLARSMDTAESFSKPPEIYSDPRLNDLIQYINDHLADDLSLSGLAERLNISKFHLSRRFKQLTGLNFNDFIRRKRLTHARYLISLGTKPFNASVEAGFTSYSYFSRSFKEFFGYNPSETDNERP